MIAPFITNKRHKQIYNNDPRDPDYFPEPCEICGEHPDYCECCRDCHKTTEECECEDGREESE